MTTRGTSRRVAAAALAVAVVLLAASIAWTAAENDDDWRWGRMGPGMMGYAPLEDGGDPVRTLAAARDQAERFADRLDLRAGEVMQFDNHFYAELVEDDGRPATEVLVDERTGAVSIEPGPAMMWNTRYGMASGGRYGMGGAGMMGGGGMMGGDPTWPGRRGGEDVSASEAKGLAERWLRDTRSGLTAGDAEPFPGYFTFHTLRDGRVTGMLSVSASTGAVWPHWWHGRFVRMSSS